MNSELLNVRSDSAEAHRDKIDRVLPLVYEELHALAAQALAKERRDHTLQATALVHEAYLRLTRIERIEWRDRSHVVSVAAHLIRRVLVDHARARKCEKRIGQRVRRPLHEGVVLRDGGAVDLVALDEVLNMLAQVAPRSARVVEMKHFGNATMAEIASACGVAVRTVERDWQFAKAWMYRAMSEERRSNTNGR